MFNASTVAGRYFVVGLAEQNLAIQVIIMYVAAVRTVDLPTPSRSLRSVIFTHVKGMLAGIW